jgi:glycosyltransferase involved in cell wall biosynthesis
VQETKTVNHFNVIACVWPKVSIVVVNYNGLSSLGSLLYKCLESLLSTDYPDFEIIFVDNASNDNSIEYVKKSFSDRRLKVLSSIGTLCILAA